MRTVTEIYSAFGPKRILREGQLTAPETEYHLTTILGPEARTNYPRPLRCRCCGGDEFAVSYSRHHRLAHEARMDMSTTLLICCNRCLGPMDFALVNYGDDYEDLEFAGLA